GEGIVGSVGPDGVEVLIGPSAQQKGTRIGHAFLSRFHRGVGRRPAAVLEAVAAVLVRPSRCLHDPVEGQIREYNDFAHSRPPILDTPGFQPWGGKNGCPQAGNPLTFVPCSAILLLCTKHSLEQSVSSLT